ncbi:MAG: aromatic ring-hydroxylating dioxygenase subunit alpha [Reyranella sp.]|uniref:aromatic ring-hydroxylating dioxygenase subunit alpha n=1 Tax=Reyranella sp. TaxID=1929291 RepID=UPI0011F9B59A|nr:aromatic ring-hydroxylating dioxygenase subunit alpha [Reyranella sp.]TAJ38054.1 MAG: aromatic ring-hydroxylating dioxygenase subunit alpha [Reyranella sp.]
MSAATNVRSAYGLERPTYNAKLTEVGRGTPMGELLRRYWHPVGMASDAGATPRPVKILGEELILFRDGQGQAGLVYPRCCHRGTTLYYGKVEERGIRCCYHGWLFDVEGRCLEMPCEPNPTGAQCQRVRQPWYPVEERYGLVFAYLGPPDKKPVLPRYECLEVLQPGEFVEADDSSIGSGGIAIAPCNWLQHFENVVDPYHVPILHGSFSGPQFAAQMNAFPKVKFEYGRQSVKATSIRPGPDGRRFRRVTEAVVPTLRVVANPQVAQYGMVESIGWTLPIDDTHYRIYVAGRVREKGELTKFKSRYNGKAWAELTPEEHQKFPGDTEAQVGQGAITFHSEEHLMSSDQGVSMLRILLQKQIDIVASGGNPIGVAFDEGSAYVKFDAGQYLDETST